VFRNKSITLLQYLRVALTTLATAYIGKTWGEKRFIIPCHSPLGPRQETGNREEGNTKITLSYTVEKMYIKC
jgi:hypothetical protein